MYSFNVDLKQFIGPGGRLTLVDDDDASLKLAMLIEGECSTEGPSIVAPRFGFTRQRYYQIKDQFIHDGVRGLINQKRGPKTTYRRKEEVICQTIRHRFLDPDASAGVIAQKLRQSGFRISVRSVERIIEQFGLQKKTLHLQPEPSK